MHLDAAALFRQHAAFVAGFLLRLGVPRASLDDAVQEVFLVVHRRGGFEATTARPTTWLAEIALRVASSMRSRSRRDAQHRGDDAAGELPAAGPSPYDAAATGERLDLGRALAGLTLDHRAVFVLYEVEEESCEDIAAALGVPLGTVHSRLHHARLAFQKALARLEHRAPRAVAAGGDR